jgi:hypothetical protein
MARRRPGGAPVRGHEQPPAVGGHREFHPSSNGNQRGIVASGQEAELQDAEFHDAEGRPYRMTLRTAIHSLVDG